MGVDYTAVIALGKEFTSEDEAVKFIRDAGLLTEDLEDEIEDYGLQECTPHDLTFQSLDLYSGGYYYLGFPLKAGDPEKFRVSLNSAIENWNKLFPNYPARVINTVRYS